MAKAVEPMTSGSISKRMIFFALPLLLGNLFQQLYNTVDSLIVGNFLGSSALAAVSSSGSLIFMLIGFLSGISSGAGVVVSRYFGAEDKNGVHRAVHTTVAFGLVARIVDDCGRCFAVPTDSDMDGDAGECYAGINYIFTDLFFRFSGLCHVQHLCRYSASDWGQPPSTVLSDDLLGDQSGTGYPVY